MSRVTFGFKRDDGSLVELTATVEHDALGNVEVHPESNAWDSLTELEHARALVEAWPQPEVWS